MTSITQDHDSGICHAASENRRKLLIQLKQLADEFENCHHEVRNDRGKLSQHKTSLEKECSGMNGNGKGIQQFTTYGNQIGNSNGNGKGAWCGSEKVNGRNKEGKQKFEILLQNNRHRHNCCGGQGFQKSTAQANQNGKFNGTGWCGAEKLNKETNGNNVKEFVEVIEMKYDNDGVRGGENSNKDITEYKDKYGEDIVDRNLGVIKDRDDVFNKLRHYVMKLEEVPENGAWCGSEKVNGSEKEGKRSFELVKNVEELKDGKKGTWCGVDGLNRNGKRKNGVWAEEMRMKEMHECGGRNFGVEGERSKERNGNDDAYHNRQNEINEMLEKFGGRNCCVKDDNAKKHGIEMILKKLETARDRCNDYQVGQRQNGSTKVGQRGNNNCVLVQISDRVRPNCDKVRPLFQNCRPGCGYKDQPLITFPEYPIKPDYKLTKPTTKCDNERGQLSGGVLESCECTKRNGLQDQCRSHCHETESGNKLTVDC